MIEALSAIASALADLQSVAGGITAPSAADPAAAVAPSDTSFAAALRGALDRLDGTVASANGAARAFAAGDREIPLSDVMVSLEQANLSMQLAANVRDKVVGAYSSIMNMQI